MLTTEQIRTVAQAKVKDYQKCMDLLEPVLTALERFSGKSITGNRTKIIDAIKQIDNNLFVNIDKHNGFGGIFYDFEITYHTTYQKVVENHTLFSYSLYLFNLTGQRENIVNIEKIRENTEKTKGYRQRDIDQITDTANNIELISRQVNELRDKLNKLKYNSDTELTKLYGIDFNN